MPKLVVKSGSQGGREIELNSGTLHVGRTPDNEIVVLDPSISQHHCELHVSEIGVAVLDLGSTNGTFINHTQVARGMLQNGDVLTLGQIDFSVELEEVTIAIPEMRTEEIPGAAFQEDGTPACFNHRDQAALVRCTRCEMWWCADCVRQLKRLSGESLVFCPDCSAACVPIERDCIARRKSFLERVGDTLRIHRKN